MRCTVTRSGFCSVASRECRWWRSRGCRARFVARSWAGRRDTPPRAAAGWTPGEYGTRFFTVCCCRAGAGSGAGWGSIRRGLRRKREKSRSQASAPATTGFRGSRRRSLLPLEQASNLQVPRSSRGGRAHRSQHKGPESLAARCATAGHDRRLAHLMGAMWGRSFRAARRNCL